MVLVQWALSLPFPKSMCMLAHSFGMQEVRSSLTDNGHKVPAEIDLTPSEHAAVTVHYTHSNGFFGFDGDET